jgi:hypothetical protein
MIKMLGFRVDRYVDGTDLPDEFVTLDGREFETINRMYAFLAEELGSRLPRPVGGTIEWHMGIIDSSPSFEHGLCVTGLVRLPRWGANNPDAMISIHAEVVLT